jgi:hypothetical protein
MCNQWASRDTSGHQLNGNIEQERPIELKT